MVKDALAIALLAGFFMLLTAIPTLGFIPCACIAAFIVIIGGNQ